MLEYGLKCLTSTAFVHYSKMLKDLGVKSQADKAEAVFQALRQFGTECYKHEIPKVPVPPNGQTEILRSNNTHPAAPSTVRFWLTFL